jgi:hypothetical protein
MKPPRSLTQTVGRTLPAGGADRTQVSAEKPGQFSRLVMRSSVMVASVTALVCLLDAGKESPV